MRPHALPLALLLLSVAGCPPAAPPPADPSDEPAPPPADPAPDEPAGEPDAPPAETPPDPASPDEPPAAVPTTDSGAAAEPAAAAARLLAAADCFPRAVAALQAEPRDGESLEAFLGRGLAALRAAGPLPGSCGFLQPDGPAVPICPGGNRVRLERTEVSRDLFEGGREDVQLRYTFDCGGDVTTATELTWSVGGP